MVEGVRQYSVISFIRALIPFMRATPSGPNHFQRPHFLLPLHWVRISTYEFQGGVYIQSRKRIYFFHLFFNRWLLIVLLVKQILWHLYLLCLKKRKESWYLYRKRRFFPSESFVIQWLQTSFCKFLHLLSNVNCLRMSSLFFPSFPRSHINIYTRFSHVEDLWKKKNKWKLWQ